ncbi:hypothetical protein PCANB_001897 [Pneumocystis canis]|nr:hypothetical protein PCANB_001897 [Pneumocystis canis]
MEKTRSFQFKNINPLLLSGAEFESITQNLFQENKTLNHHEETFNYIGSANSLFTKKIFEQKNTFFEKSNNVQENTVDSKSDNYHNSQEYEKLVTNKGFFARTSFGKLIYFNKKYKKMRNSNIMNFENYCEIPIHKLCNFSDSSKHLFEYNDYNFPQPIESQLWTEKHAPKKFTDLLGDERINREVLRWIKHWDFCVFGKCFLQSKIFEKDDEFNYDFLKRPKQKILMLTGPPGLGKTTLAHIAARQAGYNVVEINASNDRTDAVVKNQISNALDIQSINTNRPTLIVIDEIDGVSNSSKEHGFIKSLVDILIEDDYITRNISLNKPTAQSKRNKIKSKKKLLLRPIICICNDLYTAALRPIKQYAKIIYFKQTSISSLVSRMHKICTIEDLSVDIQILTTLCETFENDFRSCLNALQFYKTNKIDLTSNSLNTIKTKLKKDPFKSLNIVLDKIFFFPNNNKNHKNKYISDSSDRFIEIYETVQNYGDYEKLINNCFMRYLSQDYKDDNFSKLILVGDWLFFSDILNCSIYEKQNIELLSYLAFPLLIFHILFISVKNDYKQNYQQNIKQNSDWELYESQKINKEICASLYYGSAPRLQQIFCLNQVSTDVNLQLVKNAEKKALNRVVNNMISFNISYSQTKTDDGTFLYSFEPPIETLATFDFYKKNDSIILKYSICQIISMELENEKCRIQKERYDKNLNESLNITSKHKRKLDETFNTKNTITKDFFGRPISNDKDKNLKNFNDGNKQIFLKPKAKVWVKFHEGYSNAVRKPILIEDILK